MSFATIDKNITPQPVNNTAIFIVATPTNVTNPGVVSWQSNLRQLSESFYLSGRDAHDFDGGADHVSGALLAFRSDWHPSPPTGLQEPQVFPVRRAWSLADYRLLPSLNRYARFPRPSKQISRPSISRSLEPSGLGRCPLHKPRAFRQAYHGHGAWATGVKSAEFQTETLPKIESALTLSASNFIRRNSISALLSRRQRVIGLNTVRWRSATSGLPPRQNSRSQKADIFSLGRTLLKDGAYLVLGRLEGNSGPRVEELLADQTHHRGTLAGSSALAC
jgi:hypothetical protein